ncbi:MAG: polyprenyl synthetase family protein [Chloroflexi bacterium]|nr:polyprenyl synthetase family protein [Chloroflexota bacterium]
MHHLTTEMLPAIQAELKAVLRAEIHPPVDHLHGMMQYHMGWLDEQFEPLESNAGKQIRPLLCLLACHAAGGDWRQALPAAAAVELLHNFSLIHDDIEDNSPTRRGRATSWRIWGVPLAINAGDAMFSVAHLALNRLVQRGVSADIIVRALRRFDETCLALTQGQQADMLFESRTEVSVEEYVAMITGKTSVLLALCAELGALWGWLSKSKMTFWGFGGMKLSLANRPPATLRRVKRPCPSSTALPTTQPYASYTPKSSMALTLCPVWWRCWMRAGRGRMRRTAPANTAKPPSTIYTRPCRATPSPSKPLPKCYWPAKRKSSMGNAPLVQNACAFVGKRLPIR